MEDPQFEDRLQVVRESLQVHRQDCKSLGHPVHRASDAALLVGGASTKYKLNLHRRAAVAKHAGLHEDAPLSALRCTRGGRPRAGGLNNMTDEDLEKKAEDEIGDEVDQSILCKIDDLTAKVDLALGGLTLFANEELYAAPSAAHDSHCRIGDGFIGYDLNYDLVDQGAQTNSASTASASTSTDTLAWAFSGERLDAESQTVSGQLDTLGASNPAASCVKVSTEDAGSQAQVANVAVQTMALPRPRRHRCNGRATQTALLAPCKSDGNPDAHLAPSCMVEMASQTHLTLEHVLDYEGVRATMHALMLESKGVT